MGRIEGLFVHREKFTGETENTLDISCSSLKMLGSLHGLAKRQNHQKCCYGRTRQVLHQAWTCFEFQGGGNPTVTHPVCPLMTNNGSAH
jgi:hypothetical protein